MTSPPSAAGPEVEPAAVARGVVAVAHVARLIRAPSHAIAGPFRPPGPRDDDAPVSVVDDGGEPWVLAPPWERPPAGPARLHVARSGPAEARGGRGPSASLPAGVVLLAGRLEACTVATPRRLPAGLRAALERHRACLDLDDWPALTVARFVVAGIGIAAPARDRAVRPLQPVPLDDYAGCDPDLWRIQAPAVLEHLNATHADALLELARRAGAPEATLAAAHAVDPHGVTVAVIGDEGGRYLRLPFREPLASPAEVGAALLGRP